MRMIVSKRKLLLRKQTQLMLAHRLVFGCPFYLVGGKLWGLWKCNGSGHTEVTWFQVMQVCRALFAFIMLVVVWRFSVSDSSPKETL